jgi:hypothetical protein
MRLNRASQADVTWICDTVNTISRDFGTHMSVTERGGLRSRRNHG